MNGYAVHRTRVHHHRQCSCKGCSLERLEVFLTNHLRREISRRTVLARPWSTIGKIMLRTGSHMILVDMVGIIALITLDFGFHHPCIDNSVLTEALPDTRPTRITTQVDHGIIHPRTVSCTTLVSGDFSTCLGQFCIECRTDIDRLREKRSTLCIGHTVVMVKTVDIGNTKVLHGFLLNNTYPLLPLLHTWCPSSRRVEDRAHLPFGDERVEHMLVEFPYPSGLPLVDIHRETTQSFNDLLIGHLQ